MNLRNQARRPRALIFYNGYFENFGEAIVRHLQSAGNDVMAVQAPLLSMDTRRIRRYIGPDSESVRERRSKLKVPLSFVLDPFHILLVGRTRVDITLSCHVIPILLIRRALRLTSKVVFWSVDYSPQRFRVAVIESIYRKFEKWSIQYSDIQVDISTRARNARYSLHGLTPGNSSYIVPSGIWSERLLPPRRSRHSAREIALIGVLQPHVGGMLAVRAIDILKNSGVNVKLHVFGEGPDRESMERYGSLHDLDDRIVFYDFDISISRRNSILENCMVGLAPYVNDPLSISMYGDPGKVKDYAAASIPTVITNVPPVSELIATQGIGLVVNDDPISLANAIRYFVENEDVWWLASKQSMEFAKSFEWQELLKDIPM